MRFAMITVLSAALVSPMLTGCDGDKQVSTSHDESKTLTGTPQTTDKTTYQRPDGSTYTNTDKQTSPSH